MNDYIRITEAIACHTCAGNGKALDYAYMSETATCPECGGSGLKDGILRVYDAATADREITGYLIQFDKVADG